jgi:hypothetical protein
MPAPRRNRQDVGHLARIAPGRDLAAAAGVLQTGDQTLSDCGTAGLDLDPEYVAHP